MRVVALQRAQGEKVHMKRMSVVIALQCVVLLGVSACVVVRLTTAVAQDWFGTLAQTLLSIILALTVVGLAMAAHAFRSPLRVAQHVAQQTVGRRGEEALRSYRSVRRQLMATLFCGVTTVLALGTEFASHVLFVYHRDEHDYIYEIFKTFFYGFDLVVNAAVILLLSGLVRVHQPSRFAGKCTTNSAKSFTDTLEHTQWNNKVKELSERGITLGALLGFYAGLGQRYMPHFNPDVHSTADVVRQAIIPLTANNSEFGPCALSTQLMGGTSIPAQCMVTHAWSNKFADLIAAIVADALGLSTYEAVLPRLKPAELPVLMKELHQKGFLGISYWVCAACVNQHAGICSVNPGQQQDPVSCRVHPVCSCGHQKFWNITPPLRFDGEGILCEMNKFDDMMLYLSANDPSFRQVIAVDREFELFQRAWCVSEIHLAHSSYINAAVKCHTHKSLELHQSALMSLCVQDMESSRREDKAMILGRIGNLNDFNETLRWIVLDEDTGIFANCQDSVHSSHTLGRFVGKTSSSNSSSSSTVASIPSSFWSYTARTSSLRG